MDFKKNLNHTHIQGSFFLILFFILALTAGLILAHQTQTLQNNAQTIDTTVEPTLAAIEKTLDTLQEKITPQLEITEGITSIEKIDENAQTTPTVPSIEPTQVMPTQKITIDPLISGTEISPTEIPTLTPTELSPTQRLSLCSGDTNGDNIVNLDDITNLIGKYNREECGLEEDIDNNCKIDIFDFRDIIQGYGCNTL